MPPEVRTCVECGASFALGERYGRHQRYCSAYCRMNAGQRRFRARGGHLISTAERRRRAWRNTSRIRGWAVTKEASAYVLMIATDPCVYCGDPAAEIDHIVADGGNSWDNLTTCCKRCNRSKGQKSLLLALCRLNGAWYRDQGLLEVAA